MRRAALALTIGLLVALAAGWLVARDAANRGAWAPAPSEAIDPSGRHRETIYRAVRPGPDRYPFLARLDPR